MQQQRSILGLDIKRQLWNWHLKRGSWLSRLSFIPVSLATVALSAEVTLAQVAQLQQWSFDPVDNQLQVTVKEGVKPRYFLMAQPARLVLDLPDTQVGQVNVQGTYQGAVRQIRVSQFQPGLTRIVMELDPDVVLAPEQARLEQLDGSRWSLRPLLEGSKSAETVSNPAEGTIAHSGSDMVEPGSEITVVRPQTAAKPSVSVTRETAPQPAAPGVEVAPSAAQPAEAAEAITTLPPPPPPASAGGAAALSLTRVVGTSGAKSSLPVIRPPAAPIENAAPPNLLSAANPPASMTAVVMPPPPPPTGVKVITTPPPAPVTAVKPVAVKPVTVLPPLSPPTRMFVTAAPPLSPPAPPVLSAGDSELDALPPAILPTSGEPLVRVPALNQPKAAGAVSPSLTSGVGGQAIVIEFGQPLPLSNR